MENKESMNICFVLTNYDRRPSGGFKIVYEYANRLCAKGHKVSIFYINNTALINKPIPAFTRDPLIALFTRIFPRWFKLDKRIKKINGRKDYSEYIKDVDVVIATAVQTAEFVKDNFNCKKAYFIQDYENWGVSDEYVTSTYKLGLKNIVISKWLEGIVDKYSKDPSVLISNPIDINAYKIKNTDRYKHSVAFLNHIGEHKGTQYTIKAIELLKEKYPDLKVYSFGTCKGDNLPSYVEYTRSATQEETIDIYNKANVFMCSSINEGYGLTGLEAMACGCALCSSEYPGVYEYAKDGYNALLSPIKDSEALANNVIRLFEDEKLRNDLVNNGQASVKEGFTWEIATDKFEKTLEELISE